MLLHFYCSHGHRLSAEDRHAGRKAKCPTCGEALIVPHPAPPSPISDSSVMRILGDAEPPPPLPSEEKTLYKRCGRCGAHLHMAAKVCEECQTYVAVLDYSLAAMRQQFSNK